LPFAFWITVEYELMFLTRMVCTFALAQDIFGIYYLPILAISNKEENRYSDKIHSSSSFVYHFCSWNHAL